MAQSLLFVQVQGDARIVEVLVAEAVTGSGLREALSNAGVPMTPELFVFVDEAEEPVGHEGQQAVLGLKHGARVHVARCRRIKTTVHFLEKTIERDFPPGARVRTVKAWATREFHLDHKDAAEHVLQLCNSNQRPATDTPLQALAAASGCAVCFDFVPEKRIEG
jgi:hypothetical protein